MIKSLLVVSIDIVCHELHALTLKGLLLVVSIDIIVFTALTDLATRSIC